MLYGGPGAESPSIHALVERISISHFKVYFTYPESENCILLYSPQGGTIGDWRACCQPSSRSITHFFARIHNFSLSLKISVLMKFESWTIGKFFLNFSDSESRFSYKLYSYAKTCVSDPSKFEKKVSIVSRSETRGLPLGGCQTFLSCRSGFCPAKN